MLAITRLALGLAGCALALACQAAPLAPGQRLSSTQVEALGDLPVYDTGADRYRLLPQKTADGRGSLLLDERGVVAASHHEVMVTQAAEDQVLAAAGGGPRPMSVQYFAPTGIIIVRYGSFAQTVEGLKALQAGLPGAVVRLSIQQNVRRPS
ncbi:hypothetical protein [Castellaniella sp. GW247-6E4]|uniref:hypothetical protein n=1 Tax=Castellaniella sp. GW247-6E4 TaxID=3140380 RepID=UPI003314687B